MKKALITGITGQTGSYLAELLLQKGYEVHGIIRRSSSINTPRIDNLILDSNIFNITLFLHHGDITDANNINDLVRKIQPDEIYNLAAQSHVKVSFEIPSYTASVDAIGTLNILEAVRIYCPESKVYQASTSEMFGGVGYNMPENGYNETSPFHPRSPYGCAKLYAYWITKNYREAYNTFACNGLLFNHESPRRGETFVTKKITTWCGKNQDILNGSHKYFGLKPLELGNIHSYRDWGHAQDFAYAQYLMLQQSKPSDYVISTGETHTIKEFLEKCFKFMGLVVEWRGMGVEAQGWVKTVNAPVVVINEKYFRPSEVDYLLGDSTRARKELNWQPTFSFDDLVVDMMTYDIGLYGY